MAIASDDASSNLISSNLDGLFCLFSVRTTISSASISNAKINFKSGGRGRPPHTPGQA